ncbi:NAD(+)/NADH kinase [Baekduia sp.]|uniref:NAD(+)/NADH kinase n=1 Tax=Baekduia sp. TaxID=2600305 RepID=UPI002DF9988D|nr:NAD(+)/NADH kinase [Baekduia sp.]
MNPTKTATVMTHGRPGQTAAALDSLRQAAIAAGFVLRFDREEVGKHGLVAAEALELDAPLSDDVDLCVVLGGDGTILRALRRYAGTSVPVFAVNFGEVGFLATIDPDEVGEGFAKAFRGEFDVMTLPALALETPGGEQAAINDVSFHRKLGERVATLAYVVDGQEVGKVRCDGLVISTPAGSTGYNLANGGPVLAWGVEGYVVSFIAPHSLTARALVVSPTDVLEVHNRSLEPVDVSIDGRPAGELSPGEALASRFVREAADLAQLPGSSFYLRVRERFGRLAS